MLCKTKMFVYFNKVYILTCKRAVACISVVRQVLNFSYLLHSLLSVPIYKYLCESAKTIVKSVFKPYALLDLI